MVELEQLQISHETLKVEHAKLKAEHTKLKVQYDASQTELQQCQEANAVLRLEKEQLGKATVASILGANHFAQVAEEAASRAAVAKGVTKHSNQIHDVEFEIKVLKKQNEQQQCENEARRRANKVLELKNKVSDGKIDVLTKANGGLTARVTTLETDISTLTTTMSTMLHLFTTRDAMRDLEFFICREAVLGAGISARQMRKRQLYCFQNLNNATPSIPLPGWLQHGDVDIAVQIKHYKDNANCVVYSRPLTEDVVKTTIAEDEDDEEDATAKALMVLKLKQYYVNAGTAFGVAPKR